MARPTNQGATRSLPRRAILKGLAMAPVLFRPAPIFGASFSHGTTALPGSNPALPFSDTRFVPHYPARSPLADVVGLVEPGSDGYVSEKHAVEIEEILKAWGARLMESLHHIQSLGDSLDPAIHASSLTPLAEKSIRSCFGIEVLHRGFSPEFSSGRDPCLKAISGWLAQTAQIET